MLLVLILGAILGSVALLLQTDTAHFVPLILAGLALTWVIVRTPNWALAVQLAAPSIQYGLWLSPVKVATVVILPSLLWQALRAKRTVTMQARWFVVGTAVVILWQLIVDMLLGLEADMIVLAPAAGTVATLIMMSITITDLRFLRNHAQVQTATLAVLSMTMPYYITAGEMEMEIMRHGGLAGQPNLLSTSLARTSMFGIALVIGAGYPVLVRLGAIAALLASVYAQFAANSRGGTLSLIAGAATLVLLGAQGLARRIALALSVAALTVIVVTLAPYSFQERTIATISLGTAGNTDRARLDEMTSGRATLNSRAIEGIGASPIVGHGSSGFQRLLGAGTAVHNAYLNVGVGSGAPAMLLAIVLHVGAILIGIRAVRKAGAYRTEAAAVTAAAVAALVEGMSTPTLSMPGSWAFMLAAQLPAMIADTNKATKSQAPQDRHPTNAAAVDPGGEPPRDSSRTPTTPHLA